MFNTKGHISFSAACDIVVIGNNPEMADYDNPRGDLHGFAGYVVAEDERGYRRVLPVGKATRDERAVLAAAETVAARLAMRFQALGKYPVGFDRWVEDRPAYASDAYLESGQGYEDAMIERMEDERGW